MCMLLHSNIYVNYVHYRNMPGLYQTESSNTYRPLLLSETIAVSDFL